MGIFSSWGHSVGREVTAAVYRGIAEGLSYRDPKERISYGELVKYFKTLANKIDGKGVE